MKKLYEKSELTFAIIWIIVYVVLFSAADQISHSLGFEKIITAPVSVLLALALFFWIKKHSLSKKYGLCLFKGNWKNYLYFAPLLLIMTTNLWNGAAMHVSPEETVLYILSMFCAGFMEEVIFRGLLFLSLIHI